MRRRRRYHHKSKMIALTVMVMAIMIVISGMYGIRSAGALSSETGNAAAAGNQKWEQIWPNWKDVLFSGLPGLAGSSSSAPVVIKSEITAQSVLRGVVMFLANIDIKDTRSLFRVEIPLLAAIKPESTVSAMTVPNFPKFDFKSTLTNGKPVVGIYHTHTAESFIPNSGVTHRPGGQRGEIVEVGDALAKRLDERGYKAIVSKNIHDYPSFMKAYGPSEITAKEMLAENPSIQMIFDIHRDADKRENSIATVAGVTVARMSIVVAKGQPDLVQPHWQQNHAFAKLIDAKLNQYFPGVSKGIQLVDWRFNQHLHPRALLLEVGCQENSKEEAMRTMELLGDILAEIMAENKNE